MARTQIEDRYLNMLTEREYPTMSPMESDEVMGENTMPADAPMQLAMAGDDQPGFGGVSAGQFMRGLADTGALGVKGAAQGFVGLPGDIISLMRGAFDFAKSGGDFDALVAGLDKPTGLYTTEQAKAFFDRVAPLGPDQMLSEVYRNNPDDAGVTETAGEFLAPGGYIKGAKYAVRGVKAGAKALAPKAGEMLGDYMQRSGLQPNLVAFHGTPHKFGKFDSSKIGTGEGAQAFGHGLYFAESKDVAKGYQTSISKDGFLVGNKVFDPATLKHLNVKVMVGKGQLDEAIAKAEQIVNEGGAAAPMAADDLKTLVEIKAQGGLKPNKGRLLTVDIPNGMVANMLEWDAPLSQQPKAVQDFFVDVKSKPGENQTLGEWLKPMIAEGSNITDDMQKAGIPGIRYLDQGSRSNFQVQNSVKGKPYGEPVSFMTERQAKEYAAEQAEKGFSTNIIEGTRNLVVFPGGEADIKILKTEGTK